MITRKLPGLGGSYFHAGGMVMKLRLIRYRRGYSLTFWTIFFGFILIPIIALSIELGRYVYARAEMAKAADAAALAATAENNQRVFEETGDLQPTSKTWANAQTFANMNNGYLAQYGVNAVVTGISVDINADTVLVQVSANLERLFPSVVPDVMVTANGYAEIQALTRCDIIQFRIKPSSKVMGIPNFEVIQKIFKRRKLYHQLSFIRPT